MEYFEIPEERLVYRCPAAPRFENTDLEFLRKRRPWLDAESES